MKNRCQTQCDWTEHNEAR